jgi:Flp pilus assembly pilin Flp
VNLAQRVRSRLDGDKGVSAVEYSFIIATVAGLIIFGLGLMGTSVSSILGKSISSLEVAGVSPPNVPTGSATCTVGQCTGTYTWNHEKGAAGYDVLVSDSPDMSNPTTIYVTKATAVVYATGPTFYMTVESINSSGNVSSPTPVMTCQGM